MTNQEAIADLETLLAYIPIYRRFYQSISMGIKALEQVDMIDKIRAEIEELADADGYGDYQLGFSFGLMMAMEIIDKYKAESEEV